MLGGIWSIKPLCVQALIEFSALIAHAVTASIRIHFPETHEDQRYRNNRYLEPFGQRIFRSRPPTRGHQVQETHAGPYSSPKKCRMAKLNCRGSCRKAKWLVSGRINSPARGIIAAIYSVCSRLIASSWSPSTPLLGVSIALCCASLQFGCSAHILLIWSTKLSYSLGVAEWASYSWPARSM